MRILVVGNKGQLGHDMAALSQERGHAVEGVDIPEIDITDREGTVACVAACRPDVVVNCAAYTAVDACEENESDAFAVNAEGVLNLACAASGAGARLVHISTDYVFDGRKGAPYVESDTPNPLSAYGRSKLEGERMLMQHAKQWYIFRLSWLYGTVGRNFVKTIRDAAARTRKTGGALRVVNDQIGTPTYAMDASRQILDVVEAGKVGLYHCSNEGACSWYEFARCIVEAGSIDVEIRPCTTAQYPRPAPRPAYSVLDNARLKELGMNRMPHWREGFEAFLRDEQKSSSAVPAPAKRTAGEL